MSMASELTLLRAELYLRGEQGEEDIPLLGEIRVGREQDSDLCIANARISRYHARIRPTAEGLIIEDLHSTNGTYVNGRRLDNPQLLAVGDEVRFHHTAYRVVGDVDAVLEETLFGEFIPASEQPPEFAPPRRPGSQEGLAAAVVVPQMPATAESDDYTRERFPLPAGARSRPTAIQRQLFRQQEKQQELLKRLSEFTPGSWFEWVEQGGGRQRYCKLLDMSLCESRFRFLASGGDRLQLGRHELAEALYDKRIRQLHKAPGMARVSACLAGLFGWGRELRWPGHALG